MTPVHPSFLSRDKFIRFVRDVFPAFAFRNVV